MTPEEGRQRPQNEIHIFDMIVRGVGSGISVTYETDLRPTTNQEEMKMLIRRYFFHAGSRLVEILRIRGLLGSNGTPMISIPCEIRALPGGRYAYCFSIEQSRQIENLQMNERTYLVNLTAYTPSN